jgi:Right handed beta helix region
MIFLAVIVIESNSISQFANGIVHGAQPSAQPMADFQYTIPGAAVCGRQAVLGGGPRSAPPGAIVVPAGNDDSLDLDRPGTTYWFAPGVHTLGASDYAQIDPGAGAVYTGAPGAVLDGQHRNDYAFGGTAPDVRISYLTIENFGGEGANQNEGVVNHDSAARWTVDHSTITENAGAGVMLGTHNTLSYDCLSDNQQYGFSAYSSSGTPAALMLDHNEIIGNDTYNWESKVPGCGCSGGGKFWGVDGAVIVDNWIVGNRSVGLWADTNNRGFEITDNYIADNYSYGIIYEISYNALIAHNTFVRNGIGAGPHNGGFPTSAIYISESGADSRVASNYNQTFEITGNSFVNNWGGVVLWENANRFCNSPANTSKDACTLVDPRVVTLSSCNAKNLKKSLYFNDCRWKTQNVSVDHNVFDFSPIAVSSACTPQENCGFQGIFSEWGTYPSWSPYQATVVEKNITSGQNNHFSDNTYDGPWQFMAEQQGNVVSWWNWRGSMYGQDKGSTLTADGF